MMEVIELPIQEKIRMLEEKENSHKLRILESDTVKQWNINGKIKKSISGEQATSRNQTI